MDNKNEITLPIEMYDGRFTPDEIGVIGIIMSYPHQSKEILDMWDEDGIFRSVLEQMIDKKIIVFKDGEATINIDNQQLKPSKNMHVSKAIQELIDTHGLPEIVLLDIQDLMEEIASESYSIGYRDGEIDYKEPVFTAYGKTEDFSD